MLWFLISPDIPDITPIPKSISKFKAVLKTLLHFLSTFLGSTYLTYAPKFIYFGNLNVSISLKNRCLHLGIFCPSHTPKYEIFQHFKFMLFSKLFISDY